MPMKQDDGCGGIQGQIYGEEIPHSFYSTRLPPTLLTLPKTGSWGSFLCETSSEPAPLPVLLHRAISTEVNSM